ncbi:MAG: PIN domain-containing protein [Candidatus Chisholmbacteria bacterium]|nr:PIN domain-containing protein [Candidatus Chisholmbacteria bacterium]
MNLVLDTSAWYAYLFKKDKFYHQAKTTVNLNKPSFVIPYPVIEELAAIIHNRKGKKVALTHVYQALAQSKHTEIAYIDPHKDQ